MFHALANSNADTLIGASRQFRRLPAWTFYRALDHGHACGQMNRGVNAFGTAIEDFGLAFVDLQSWCHLADYDPNIELSSADGVNLIDRAGAAIIAFEAADATERKGFAAHVLFRNRAP